MRLVTMSVPGRLLNVSIRGGYVASEARMAAKDVIRISFCLPDGTPVVCYARVCWVNNEGNGLPRGAGIEFALLPKPAHEALAAFITGLPGNSAS
jgi:PilZ domain